MISSFFKNLVFQAKKNPRIFYKDAQLALIVSKIQEEIGEGLITLLIARSNNLKTLASINCQENMITVFHNFTRFLNHALNASSLTALKEGYKINLSNNFSILVFIVKDIQISLILDSNLANIGLIEQITLPEIKEILREL